MVKTYFGGLVSLSTLAFSLPLLSLLGAYPEFFTSHKIEAEHLLVFAFLVLFALPLILSLVIAFSSVINSRVTEVVQITFVFLLFVAISLPMINKFSFLSAEMGIGFALGLGIVFGWAYKKGEKLRSSLLLISPLILILPLSFLFNAGIQDLAFPKKWTMSGASKEILPTPIVMVIFDEFTINSVINRQGEVDKVLYPNLHWFS
ncbi:MAG: putative membrane protein (Fun14 family), partial [Candidatus Azotimanducaceae bacterium]